MFGISINLFNRDGPPPRTRAGTPNDDGGILSSTHNPDIVYSIVEDTSEVEITDLAYIEMGVKEGWLEYMGPFIMADVIRHRYRHI